MKKNFPIKNMTDRKKKSTGNSEDSPTEKIKPREKKTVQNSSNIAEDKKALQIHSKDLKGDDKSQLSKKAVSSNKTLSSKTDLPIKKKDLSKGDIKRIPSISMTPRGVNSISKRKVDTQLEKKPIAGKKIESMRDKNNSIIPNKTFTSKVSIEPDRSGARMRKSNESFKIKNSVKEANNTSNKMMKGPTNVTVNSPILNRKNESFDTESSLDKGESSRIIETLSYTDKYNENDINNLKKQHNRYRTRTLDPNEVKVINASDVIQNNTYEMSKLVKAVNQGNKDIVKAQPKTFFVPLDDSVKKSSSSQILPEKLSLNSEKQEIQNSNEGDSSSYTDDFESYESDFEAFVSSKSDFSSREDSKITDDSNTDDSELDVDITKVIGRSDAINNEESFLDSGNYEIKEANKLKSNDYKTEIIQEKPEYRERYSTDLQKTVDTGRNTSLWDEGFDENSGGFSSNSVTGNYYKLDDTISDGEYYNTVKTKKIFDKNKMRTTELLNLISLDEIQYSLFEMQPISYHIFMETFGKSNTTQSSTQTNDDCNNEATQTDNIFCDTKWCQIPIRFSNYDVTPIGIKNEIRPTRNYSFKKLTNEKDNRGSHYYENKSTPLFTNKIDCPLIIYCNQRLGCTPHKPYSKEDVETLIKMEYNLTFSKIEKFIYKVGSHMLRYLNDEPSQIKTKKIIKSDYKFSSDYSILFHKDQIDYLRECPPIMVAFSINNVNCFTTVHHNKITNTLDKNILMTSVIYVWSLEDGYMDKPVKILISSDYITCCIFTGGLLGFIVAGFNNGSISAWDLKNLKETSQNLSLSTKNEIKDAEKNQKYNTSDKTFYKCTFTSCNNLLQPKNKNMWWGSVVDGLFFKSVKDKTELNKTNKFGKSLSHDQVCTLQEYGLITVWTILEKRKIDITNDVQGDNTGSYLTLYSSLIINLNIYMGIETVKLTSVNNQNVKNTCLPEFHLTDAKRRNSLKGYLNIKNIDYVEESYELNIHKTNLTLQDMEMKRLKICDKISTPISNEDKRIDKLRMIDYSDPGIKDSENKTDNNLGWEGLVMCAQIKCHQDSNSRCHFLISCNGGRIAHYQENGMKQIPFLFYCGDETAPSKNIELCPNGLPYFLVGCYDNTVHLYSMQNGKPLKNFEYYQCNAPKNTEKLLSPTEKLNTIKLSLENSIEKIQWSKVRPCLFFMLNKNKKLFSWDLLQSDMIPKIAENNDSIQVKHKILDMKIQCIVDEKKRKMKDFMILLMSSGNIEIHTLNDNETSNKIDNNTKENEILQRYLELL